MALEEQRYKDMLEEGKYNGQVFEKAMQQNINMLAAVEALTV